MIPSHRWQQIDDLFAAALERPPAERLSFLKEASRGDAELYGEVSALLASEAEAERVLGESATAFAAPLLPGLRAGLAATDAEPLPPDQRIGPYRLLEEIGRGGMGAVYRAERADGEFEQRVALKLVKRGMDTDEILRRFRHERQILASLEHPHIARLLDGGAAEDGRPYLVMELVAGEPIDAYCERKQLGIEARLRLFRTVCEAVQYAHQNLIVHRDIKPSNILVSEPAAAEAGGTPKLLDFGIAKLLAEDPSASTPHTRTGVRMLTPDYASPEQMRGAAVTTASDVYGLGVLLHLLLTGRRPDGAARPSTLAIAERLRRRLRGDLDTIVLKAMEADPALRYPSAGALADDVRRHLDGLPIEAHAAGTAYRAAKFVRRHRVTVAATAAFLLLASAASLLHTTRITAERDLARVEADKAHEVAAFMESLFAASDPFAPEPDRVDTLRVRELLARGVGQIRGVDDTDPLVRAQMLNVLGRVYAALGLHDEAGPLLEDALSSRRALHGPEHADVAETLNVLGNLRSDEGAYGEAERLLREALAVRRALHGEQHEEVASLLNNLGLVLGYQGKLDEAESLHRAGLRINRAVLDPMHPGIAINLSTLGSLHLRKGDLRAAEPLFRESVELRRAIYGAGHPSLGVGLNNLAALLRHTDDLDGAEQAIRESLAISRKALGPEHPHVASSMSVLATILRNQGDYAAAEPLFLEVLELNRRRYGDTHVYNSITLDAYAAMLLARGDLEDAERVQREALDVARRVFGDEHLQVARTTSHLAAIVQRRGDHVRALELHRQAVALMVRLGSPDPASLASARVGLASCLTGLGRYPEAEPLLLQSYQTLHDTQGPGGRTTRAAMAALAALYEAWGKPAEQGRYQALLAELGQTAP
jgi:eukaryotic-like serine/threonine-protein kinase